MTELHPKMATGDTVWLITLVFLMLAIVFENRRFVSVGVGFFPRHRALTIFALLLVVSGCARTPNGATVPTGTPVIIVSIDTLRADHLPAYGYRGVETPSIDRFAHDAMVFENAYSHVPLTLPSHVTMLTGALPPDHGVRDNSGFTFDPTRTPTIATLVKTRGYATGAAVSAYVLRGATGLGRAFDFYDDRIAPKEGAAQGEVQRDGEKTSKVAQQWIAQNASRPFFFFLHLYEPHSPYTPPEPFRSRYVSAYDGEIATADAIAGRFFDFLRSHDLYERSIIILMSDHGEGLSQHGEAEHGIFLYREALRVPLMIKLPHNERGNSRVGTVAGLTDILPTIGALVGFQPPAAAHGRSLLASGKSAVRSVYAESLYPRLHLGWSEVRSLIDDRFQYIEAPRAELFDVVRDPAERENLIHNERRVGASMLRTLSQFSRGASQPSAIAPEDAKKLAALGYLTSAPAAGAGPLPDPKDGMGQLDAVRAAARLDASGDHAGAIAAYHGVLTSNPRFRDVWKLMAKAQEQNGRSSDAIESYKQSIRLAPAVPSDDVLEVSRLSLELGRFDEAQQHAELALRSSPLASHLMLGRIALARRDSANAEREARIALTSDPTSKDAEVLLAQALVAAGRHQEAAAVIERIDRSSAAEGPVPLLDLVRGDLLARTDHVTEAMASFAREIKAFPHERQPYASLALLQLLQRQPAAANQTLERLVRANPDGAAYALASRTVEAVGDRRSAAAWRARAPRDSRR